ncbi:SPOR domain-containing protein [Mesorhizobium sp. AR10]|uniref:SPOR domain-containing protein n=1 Tax=Mesorhizobium sp. AR10 TaxID=2865839 RepID=UPI00215E0BF8|nr:SPOR domain-containing protein [Mesorhizobium sp. AR10]UVK36569.1 SPOR domain-containing protein [Mesorhizobium sp. AR10]
MADRTQLKVADHNDIAADDPFAELTRIMGFDPRQPVKPQKAAPTDEFADEGDFDIDLEKELMGEFGTGDDDVDAVEVQEPAAEFQEPAFETAATDAMDDALAASLEQDFLLDDDTAEAAHGLAAATEAPVQAFEAAFDDDFDNAVASSLEDVSPLEDDLPMDDKLAVSLEQGYLDDDATDEAGYSTAPVAEAAAPVVEAQSDDDFDNAVSISLEDELTLDGHMHAEDHHAGLAAVEVAESAVAPVEAVADAEKGIADEDFTDHFDDAMADVDMDFEVRADQPVAVDEPLADDAFAGAVDASDDAYDVAPQEAFDDFDLTFDDALVEDIEEPVAQIAAVPAQPTVAPAVTVEPAAPVAAADERTLEDELNALLGTMKTRTSPVAEEPAMVQQPVAAVEKSAAQPTDPVAALDWDLDEHEPVELPHAEVVQAADAGLDNLLLDELEGQDVEAPAAGADIEFDDDAFDAAFAKGIDLGHDTGAGKVAHAASDEDTGHSLDWMTARSTPPEPARSWSRVTPVAQSQPSFTAQPMASLPPAPAAPSYREHPAENVSAHVEPAPAPYEQPQRYDEMPDVETVDVPERVVALADDLDIPELNFDEDEPAAQAYDDLDAEFASLLTDMNATEVAAAPVRSTAYDDDSYSSGFKSGYERDRNDARSYAARPAEVPANAAAGAYTDAANGFDIDDLPGSQPVSKADDFTVDELDYDPELDDAMSVPGLAEQDAARQPRRSGLLVAAVVGAVAIAGGLGAFALSFGGKGGSDAPVIVKADNAPIKVKPENPGGTVVPNQDNKVYDAVVKGTKPAEPVQEKLVTNTEEPVDVTANEPQSRVVDLSPNDPDAAQATEAAPGTDAAQGTDTIGNADAAVPAPKSEDRIAQALQEADKSGNPDVVAIAPRKVRTMVVKPDGSLVAREDPTPAGPQVAATEPVDPAPQLVAPPAQADAEQTGTVPPATDQASGQAGADQTEIAKPAAAPKAEAQSANTPATVPLAPQRPSDQPVDVVGEVKPDQVASIPTTASTGGGSWSMQIASQPTVESAQSSYADLQRRYGSVLSGRTANIVKAEIAGKGTFYRVRVPAQSRNDAINLCTSYKAAGGNCFVSR